MPDAPRGARVANLWEYDVVECFLVGPDGRYLELELGAGGHFLALLFDAPFLSHTFTHLHLPLVGDVELATAMLFDLGVFVAVVGAVMVMLARLGWLSTSETPGTYRQETDPWRS